MNSTIVTLVRNYFRRPTPLEVIAAELAVAQLSKLEAETAVDYAVSVVRYNDTRIARLTKHLTAYQGAINE